MGMFDSLLVNCPQCGNQIEFQSKAGECSLAEYSIFNVPPEVALDCSKDVEICSKCGELVKLHVQSITTVQPFI